MANLFSQVVTYTNTGGNGVTLGANYSTATATTENFGTRELTFLKIAGTLSASAVDISSAAFRAAVARGVQVYAEMYGFGATDASSPYDVVVVVSEDTANGADSGNTQGTGFGLMEAAILAQVNGVASGTLDAVVVTKYTGFSGDILAA